MTMEPFPILGTEHLGVIVLGVSGVPGLPPDTALVRVAADGLAAERWVTEYPDFSGLERYFTDLERHWRGWTGMKSWSSLEGEFSLDAEHTGARIRVVARLVSERLWEARADFAVGAGEELSAARSAVRKAFA